MSIQVVGLGPGPADWLSVAAHATLTAPGARVYLRTALHPAAEGVLAGAPYTAFDKLFEQASSLAELGTTIADTLLAASAAGSPVVYAVPGDGLSGESVVAMLLERDPGVQVVPGVSEALAVAAAARLDSTEGLQSVDALGLGGTGVHARVELNPRWPAVVTGVYSRTVASEVKQALQRVYPEDWPVLVVRHPGQADERVSRTTLPALDRGSLDLDHLTHVAVDRVPTEVPTGSAHGVRAVVSRLRAPEIGCPWDLQQTHESLIPYVIEEAYEVVEAIQDGVPGALMDELGDLVLQVALHAELADQDGAFDLNDVMRALSAKLIRRHPHVFGEVEVDGASDVVRNWDALKAAERANEPPRTSALDGIPKSLPALKLAAEQGRKAARAGFAWQDRQANLAKVREELDELLAAESLAERREELGDLLWVIANLATNDGVDPEEALRDGARKFGGRFREMERLAAVRGWATLQGRSTGELLTLWRAAKQLDQPLLDASETG